MRGALCRENEAKCRLEDPSSLFWAACQVGKEPQELLPFIALCPEKDRGEPERAEGEFPAPFPERVETSWGQRQGHLSHQRWESHCRDPWEVSGPLWASACLSVKQGHVFCRHPASCDLLPPQPPQRTEGWTRVAPPTEGWQERCPHPSGSPSMRVELGKGIPRARV